MRTFVGFAVLVSAAVVWAKDPNPARWDKTMEAFDAKDKATPPPKDAVVFTGSSSIVGWANLAKHFPEYPVLNRGFGGSTTPEVNHHLERVVLRYKPRVVVLYSGSNDIPALQRTPEEVHAEFRKFVSRVQATLSETRIAYISIHTPPGRLKLKEAYEKTNRLIADTCAKDPKLAFIDIRDTMLGKDGQPDATLYRDPLHPTAAAYDKWAERVRPTLAKWLGTK